MNYYAQGGQAQGLKALAQELPKYGRGGDSIVAHINPEEAQMLKAMGGSGTINPTTGLPEFLSLGKLNPVKALSGLGDSLGISQAATKVFQPIEKAVVQPASKGLASFDKLVGNTIPGGWGTLGMMAGSAIGLSPLAMTTMGALNGSAVMRPGGKFNLQGAMMGGAMAYGMSELGEYARGAADGAVGAVEKVAQEGIPNVIDSSGFAIDPNIANASGSAIPNIQNVTPSSLSQYSPSFGSEALTQPIGSPITNPALSTSGLSPYAQNIKPIGMGGVSQTAPGIFDRIGTALSNAPSNAAEYVSNIPGRIADSASNAYDAATKLSNYTDAIDRGMTNVGKTASGIGNILTGSANPAAAAAVKSGAIMSPMMATGMTVYGGMGLQALDEQRKYLQDQANSGAISQSEYNNSLAEIERQADIARKTVAANPLQLSSSADDFKESPSLYGKREGNETLYEKNPYEGATLYATGGAVNALDDQTRMPGGSPMTNFLPSSSYTASHEEELAAMRANQAAGIQTMGGLGGMTRGLPTNNPSGVLSQTSAAQTMQSTGSPQSLYGGAPSSLNGNSNAFPLEGQYGIVKMAAGGMAPRFLSGGGDGMSDSIPANIGGTQEARLADGEFVIPADVVSHLGNGSSKAGAKQLYSMMDKVRQARVGTKKQGKQINPRKYLAV